MTLSEDHICFRMLCLQVNQARFVVSAENFMKVLLLSYDVVRPYEQDRGHVAACECIPQSLQSVGGLHLPPGPLHLCDGVAIQCGPIH